MSELQGIRTILFGILLATVGIAIVAGTGGGPIALLGIVVMFVGLGFGVRGQFGVAGDTSARE